MASSRTRRLRWESAAGVGGHVHEQTDVAASKRSASGLLARRVDVTLQDGARCGQRHAGALEGLTSRPARLAQDAEEEVFHADVGVAERDGLLGGAGECRFGVV